MDEKKIIERIERLEKAIVTKMIIDGYSIKQISKIMNVGYDTIQKKYPKKKVIGLVK